MVEVSENVVGLNSSAKFQNKQFILNVLFVLFVGFVVVGAFSIFYFTSRSNENSLNGSRSSETEYANQEQYYTGMDEWYLDEIEIDEISVKQVENADSKDLEDGFRTRINEGGVLNLDIVGDKHEMFIDSVNGDSVEITIQSEPIFATINVDDQKKFDLNGDYIYDLKVSLLEIVGDEGIFQVKGISEEYQPVVQTNDGPMTTDFARFSSKNIPYSCLERDNFVDYSYLETLMAGSSVYGEKRINVVRNDVCLDSGISYRHFSCDGKNLVIETVNCDSRFESCKDAECVVTKYEKNIGKQGSPDEKLKGKSECLLKTIDTIFWFDSEEESCKDIFIASKFLSRNSFLNLLSSYEIDVLTLKDSFSSPLYIDVHYINSDGVYNNFSDVENKFLSSNCELVNYLGLDTYCFNEILDVKSNNLKYIVNVLTFLKLYSIDYSSNLFSGDSFGFLENIYFVDSSGFLFYSGIFSNLEVLSSCSGKLFDYKSSDSDFIFACESVFVNSVLSTDKSKFSNNLFREVLNSKSFNDKECKSEYVETDRYNVTKLISSGDEDKCLVHYELLDDSMEICEWKTVEEYSDGCDIIEGCVYENETVVEGHDEFYVDFDSVFGDYVKYLYAMSTNSKLACSFRKESWDLADDFVSDCTDGVKDYEIPSYPFC